MNSTPSQSRSGTSTILEAFGDEHILLLKSALEKAQNHALFGVKTTHVQAEIHFRDFCESTGNVYMGREAGTDFAIHYVKKRNMDCRACSNTRVVVLGLATLAALAYTTPQMINSNPPADIVVLFIAALAFLPPVIFNNFRLLKRALKKTAQPIPFSATRSANPHP